MEQAIGIFDSGMGGLTVAHAIHKQFPKENLLYFGDTKHIPYGDKSPDTIANYCQGITRFLLQNEVKAIVIACNTASAWAGDLVREIAAERLIPVFDVIQPAAQYISQKYNEKSVGVIGTKGTIASGIYKKTIQKINPTITVKSLATPILVPIIEEGLHDSDIARQAVKYYLEHPDFNDISALVLGCTHYPIIKKHIEEYYQNRVEVIDSASIVAKSLHGFSLSRLENAGKVSVNVSDLTPAFASVAKLFFGEDVVLSHLDIWK